MASEWIGPRAGSSERVAVRVGPAPARIGPAWQLALLVVRVPHLSLLAEWLGHGLGPVELPGWQQLLCFGLEFGPAA